MKLIVPGVTVPLRELVKERIAPYAEDNDRSAHFPSAAIVALGQDGWLGLTVPKSAGGLGRGPAAAASAVRTIAEADPSAAMVYMMHLAGTACIAAAPPSKQREQVLREIATGAHLTTLAFSETGSRSHFWAPVSREQPVADGFRLSAEKSFVTSAGHVDSYVVITQAHDASEATDTNIYMVPRDAPGLKIAQPWEGMGLRGNASSPIHLDGVQVTEDQRLCEPGKGLSLMFEVVLPIFDLSSAAVSLGICRAVVDRTRAHMSSTTGADGKSLGEALPTLRANLGRMQVLSDALAAMVEANVIAIRDPSDVTMLRVLETKAYGAEVAIEVTGLAMRTCGGAAFARRVGVDRYFRDAHAASVMAPTTAVLYEFISRRMLGMPML